MKQNASPKRYAPQCIACATWKLNVFPESRTASRGSKGRNSVRVRSADFPSRVDFGDLKTKPHLWIKERVQGLAEGSGPASLELGIWTRHVCRWRPFDDD
jgi:hypothetical protein